MKNLSRISVYLMIISGILSSFMLIQGLLGLNLFPENIEAFAFGIMGSFGILTFFIYFAALIQELIEIRKQLETLNNENKTDNSTITEN